MLDKTFNPKDVENRIYAQWEASGAFRAGHRLKTDPDAEPFCIVIPPPNVTGRLHVGHALNNTLQDVLARFERMRGKDVLWQPGMDHAGIATQLVVERQLAERQQSRVAMGREKFLEEVWRWKEESGGAIGQQLRRLGASADWSRERFTMGKSGDPTDQMVRGVTRAFVELYRQGLIYKDKRLVNWDPRLQTAVSDLEVENIEMKGHLWYIRYPLADGYWFPYPTAVDGAGNPTNYEQRDYIVVATTRPETMLGDTAVAVHPEDARYKPLVDAKAMLRLPLANRLIPIIADEHSDPEKGTGAVKITPGHDFNDFEVGKRHGLEIISIFRKDGTLKTSGYDNFEFGHRAPNPDGTVLADHDLRTPPSDLLIPEKYQGLDRFAARKQIVADLEALELLEKIEPITHSVPHDEKTKTVVLEPLLTEQWYLNVAPLAEKAVAAVEAGRTRIIPEQWQNVYFNWLRNIQPWCISRQLWWGHQIPVWYGVDGKIYCAETEEEALLQTGGKALTRDPDVLDTWFSSALWPFSTLGWPDKTPELKRYYPTSVLVTAFDIIFFWVARMMMMGLHFMPPESPGEPVEKAVPFHRAYIHNRVLDEKGAKMSKTKGNVVDPLELVDEFGADALRFTLALAAGQGRDMRIGPSRVEVNRNFATKLWNASRFCEMNGCETRASFEPAQVTHTVNRWIVAETARASAEITRNIEQLRFNDAAGAAYRFVWDVFCDWYLEFIKPLLNGTDEGAKAEARMTAAWTRDNIFALLHPFMPFITEELWARTAEHGEARPSLLIEAQWPVLSDLPQADDARAEMQWVIALVQGIRSVRAEMNVPAAAKIALVLQGAGAESSARLARHRDVVMTLARLSSAETSDMIPSGSAQFVIGEAVAALPLGDVIDFAKERARLEKELKKTNDEIARFDVKLSNEQFVAKAPEEVLTEQREKRAEAAALAARLSEAIGRLA